MSLSPDPPSDHPSQPDSPSHLVSLYQTLAAEHPRGFYQVCLAVLCERWAAFTLISTAALMLCERFGFPRGDALRILGIVSAAGYFGSLPGGHLLDRTSSPSRGIGISTLLLLLGYITLSLPLRSTLYVAFGLLIAGHSLYKPSTQRLLAAVYPSGDSRLEGAQILLHIAVNVGAAAGSLSAGLLLRHAGWSITYASAALMMSLGGVLFWQRQVDPSGIKTSSAADSNIHVDTTALSIPNRVQIIAGLTLAMFLFTLCTTQAEGALLLWAKDRIDRVVLGFEVPISWFVAFPAVLVILLAPVQLALLPKIKQCISLGSLVAIGLLASLRSLSRRPPSHHTLEHSRQHGLARRIADILRRRRTTHHATRPLPTPSECPRPIHRSRHRPLVRSGSTRLPHRRRNRRSVDPVVFGPCSASTHGTASGGRGAGVCERSTERV